ncbi:hypothetical protein L9F63_015818 [Diploptera punctata]|uniref:SMB domain-containing protein n=1 Tax=Diploptera punctata TaxID=6984 RepID=A0AAD8A5R0_DIPPU|nr:hypothetical protein L9F63_015818 [Diploptera punctata]
MLVQVAWVVLTLASLSEGGDYADLPGPYCATRRQTCCQGRYDDCSVPILGTLCYCDDFCNRTRSEDCCPDYWKTCLGIEPPAPIGSCYRDGQYYQYGKGVKVNCNQCLCQLFDNKVDLICETNECLIEQDLISRINSPDSE